MELSNPSSYKYYRLIIRATFGTGFGNTYLSQMSLNTNRYSKFITTYPVVPMTQDVTTLANGETYIASVSVVQSYNNNAGAAYNVFDHSNTTFWSTPAYGYSANGPYQGSTVTVADGVNIGGEWVQIQLPRPTTIYSVSLIWRYLVDGIPFNEAKLISIVGSTDGNSWTLLAEADWSNLDFAALSPKGAFGCRR